MPTTRDVYCRSQVTLGRMNKTSVGFNFFGVISHHAQPKPRNRMESQFRDMGMAWQYHENQIFGDTSDISSMESMDTSLISSFFRGHVDPPASQWGAKREHSKDQSYHLEAKGDPDHPGVSGVTSVHIYKWDKPLNAWWLIPLSKWVITPVIYMG